MPLLPAGFATPEPMATDRCRIRLLTVNDVVKDYDAVMTSIPQLRGLFGPGNGWPSDDMTLEQNLIDLGWHQKEGQTRSSFVFVVMSLDETKELGCLYLDPPTKQGFDAEAFLWVRASEGSTGLLEHLRETMDVWIAKSWPFETVAFPGRDISWDEWQELPDA